MKSPDTRRGVFRSCRRQLLEKEKREQKGEKEQIFHSLVSFRSKKAKSRKEITMAETNEKNNGTSLPNVVNENGILMKSETRTMRMVDGPNAGRTFQQTFYSDLEVPRLRVEIANLTAENARLKSEVEKIRNTVIPADDKSYCLTKREISGIEVIKVNRSPEEENRQKIRKDLGRFLRRKFGKTMTDSQLMEICEFLAGKLIDNVSHEAFRDAYHRKGEANDTFISTVRLIGEIVESFQFAWQDDFCQMDQERFACYSQQIAKLADCCGYQENTYKTIFPDFSGDAILASNVFQTLNTNYPHKMEKFQIELMFIVDTFSDYPFLLGQDTNPLFSYIREMETFAGDPTCLALSFLSTITDNAVKNISQTATPTSATDIQIDTLEFCAGFQSDGISARAMQDHLKCNSKNVFQKTILAPLVSKGYLKKTCQKSSSPHQKYRITPEGVSVLRQNRPGKTFSGPCLTVSENISTDPGHKTE